MIDERISQISQFHYTQNCFDEILKKKNAVLVLNKLGINENPSKFSINQVKFSKVKYGKFNRYQFI